MQFELSFNPERPEPADEGWVQAGAHRVRLRLVRHRRARRYVLRLSPDGAARVTIPRAGSIAEAKRFAQRNTAWLEKQLLRRAAQPVRPKTWPLGSEILLRGEWVRLEADTDGQSGLIHFGSESLRADLSVGSSRFRAEGTAEGRGRLVPGFDPASGKFGGETFPSLHAQVRTAVDSQVSVSADLRPVVERHLRQLAARELPVRVFELAALHQFPVARVTVRNQRSRWGSCSRRGTISLNWRLVQAPLFVRDYLILHELAHLREMNHSRRFWHEVARLCPGFKEAERWLKAHRELLA